MWKRRLAASVALAVAALATGTTANAAPGMRQCGTLLAKLQPGENTSKVLKEACSSSYAGMLKALGVQDQGQVLLMTLYTDADFGPPDTAKNWLGNDGSCDSAGYGIPNLNANNPAANYNDRISSWKSGDALCDYVDFWSDANYSGKHVSWSHYYEVNYVGDYINDQTSSIKIHYVP